MEKTQEVRKKWLMTEEMRMWNAVSRVRWIVIVLFILKFEIDALVHICELTVTAPDNWSLKINYELERTE